MLRAVDALRQAVGLQTAVLDAIGDGLAGHADQPRTYPPRRRPEHRARRPSKGPGGTARQGGGLPAGSNSSVVWDLAGVGLAVPFDLDGVTVTVTA